MKKTKLIALLLVICMLSLSSISVYAQYDPTIRDEGGIPADTWTVVTVYHWVVRGESLQDIADMYGTNIDEIKFYNKEYFDDLANRNKTTGLNIQLEHGVRLFIYHMVRVEHYVQRGDTLSDFANGKFKSGSFTLYTTETAIKAENKGWFESLDNLNKTRNMAHELEESYDMWNVRYKDIGNFVHGPNNYGAEYGRNMDAGAPLYISVPVQIKSNPSEPLYRRETYNIVRLYDGINGEITGRPVLETWGFYNNNGPQIPFQNTLATNLIPDVSERWIGYPDAANLRLTNYKIIGWAGAQAEDKDKCVWW